MEDNAKTLFNWDEEDDDTNNADDKRGSQGTGISRSQRLGDRIIEALKVHVGKAPTRDELQRLAGIKRKTFIPTLKSLIADGVVLKQKSGTKGNPFRYTLVLKQA